MNLERETGIEPATNSLEGCDSTTELLPPARVAPDAHSALRRVDPQRRAVNITEPSTRPFAPTSNRWPANRSSSGSASEGWWGGEGSNLRSPKAAGLQPAAIDRSATSPNYKLSAIGSQLSVEARAVHRKADSWKLRTVLWLLILADR